LTVPAALDPAGVSNMFGYLGNDLVLSDADAAAMRDVAYCASYRVQWVFRDATAAAPDQQNHALRVDVRVFWPNELGGNSAFDAVFAACADDGTSLSPPGAGGTAAGAEFENYHAVYLSTVIRPLL
jgi:hypothetical protein